MRLGLVALAVTAACSHGPRTGVHSAELLSHAPELGRDGQADLATTRGTRVRVALDQPVRFHGATTTLVLLLEGCAPFAGGHPCPLGPRDELVYLLPTHQPVASPGDPPRAAPPPENPRSEVRLIMGTLSLVSFAGTGLCIAYCEDNKAKKSVALGGAGALFGLIYLLAGGNMRD